VTLCLIARELLPYYPLRSQGRHLGRTIITVPSIIWEEAEAEITVPAGSNRYMPWSTTGGLLTAETLATLETIGALPDVYLVFLLVER
jgi:hypothetical protein